MTNARPLRQSVRFDIAKSLLAPDHTATAAAAWAGFPSNELPKRVLPGSSGCPRQPTSAASGAPSAGPRHRGRAIDSRPVWKPAQQARRPGCPRRRPLRRAT